jgi:dihydroxyacid dehydratase/phosphogluconate dehydratase
MLRGNHEGRTLGSGSDAFKYWDERRAGTITEEFWQGMERGIARSYGHCMTMGTASTMTAIAEALGLTLPGASSIPAADANHQRMSASCGRRIIEMIWYDLTPDQIVTDKAVENAVTVGMATGCSTNAIIHLIAMARRAGVDLGLDDLDASRPHTSTWSTSSASARSCGSWRWGRGWRWRPCCTTSASPAPTATASYCSLQAGSSPSAPLGRC